MPAPAASQAACPWANQNELLRAFHDHEWGEPVAEAGILFEYMVLHTFQLGFDFPVVLRRRESFRELLANFDPDRLALGRGRHCRGHRPPRILRNRRKLAATVQNAQAWLRLRQEVGEDGLLLLHLRGRAARRWPAERDESRTLVHAREHDHEPGPEAAGLCDDRPGELLQHSANRGPGQRPLAELPPPRRMRGHDQLVSRVSRKDFVKAINQHQTGLSTSSE
jgi:3-methyladenine DNA glycosylase Tag